MLVGNKADLRDTAAAEGQKCVPGYFGEKLAMVRVRMVPNWKRSFTFVYFHLRGSLTILYPVPWGFSPCYAGRTPSVPYLS